MRGCGYFVAIFTNVLCCVSGMMHSSAGGMSEQDEESFFANYKFDRLPNDPAYKTSIICTLGLTSSTAAVISELRDAGMTIARLNFSHGSHESHGKTIEEIRKTIKHDDRTPLAIALDTKGPEIRTGKRKKADVPIEIKENAEVIITTDEKYKNECTNEIIYVDYADIGNAVASTKKIYIDDGNLELLVERFDEENQKLYCVAQNSHSITCYKGVNLPGAIVTLPAISSQDKKDLEFAAENELDIVFASFVRSGSAIDEIRKVLSDANSSHGPRMKIIAKIENQEGVNNFKDILAKADGIMVARGDLGIEVPQQKVPVIQKAIIESCNKAGKPAICATQMLESMITKPRPTRAEVSDVFNAIVDGADCVMLSGETANGKYPIKAVQVMAETAAEARHYLFSKKTSSATPVSADKLRKDIAHIFNIIQRPDLNRDLSAIIVIDPKGEFSKKLASYRPPLNVLFLTNNKVAANQSALFRGFFPLIASDKVSLDCGRTHDSITKAAAIKEALRCNYGSPSLKDQKVFFVYQTDIKKDSFDGSEIVELK